MLEDKRIEKKKIMHISQANGGVAQYLKMLFKYMNRDKYYQILIYPEQYKDEKEDFIHLVDSIEFINMEREINLKKDFSATLKINKLINKYKPDLIYLHSSKAGALGRITNIFNKNKVIYNPHGWAFNMQTSKKKKYLYTFIEKWLSLYCDKIVAISEYEKQSALKYKICNEKNVYTINNGIDIEEYKKLISTSKLERKKLGINEDSIVIGMVGRISKQKAPDTFVNVAYKIKKKNPNSFFIIVGDGEDRELIESQIEVLGLKDSFIITGWVREVYSYIELFDVAVLLSRWEGFGLVLAEYMLSEKPIVATNIDAIPNLITNKFNGLLAEVDNIQEIERLILKIVEDSKFKDYIVKNSRVKVEQEFDIKRVAEEHEKLINKLLYAEEK